jgi:histidinol-phosphate aminotransferase
METTRGVIEKGGGTFAGIKLLLCENPLPPLDAAIDAAAAELPRSNLYTEPFSQPLREAVAAYCGVPAANIHVNAGSELILRQLLGRFGQRTHLIAPTFALFEEIAAFTTHTQLQEEADFQLDLKHLTIPTDTTLAIIVNPNNPNGVVLDIRDHIGLLERHPHTVFLVDEAFIEFAGHPVADLVPVFPNLIVTRTFSKAFSLAGLRIGYAIAPKSVVDWLDFNNDAYPLARPAQAAAMASLEHLNEIQRRVDLLKGWAWAFSEQLGRLGIRTFPTETYYFLGKIPDMSGQAFADALRQKKVLVKALDQPGLGEDFIRFTTSTPEQNAAALMAVQEVLAEHRA